MRRHSSNGSPDVISILPSGERMRALRMAVFAGAVLLGSARVSNAADFQVTNLDDMGAGSLRQAITDANAAMGADNITFAPGLTGTITVASALTMTDSVTITGPGASALRITGTPTQLISIPPNAGNVVDVSLNALTLDGGGTVLRCARVDGETLRMANVSVTNASNAGIFATASATVDIQNAVITGNSVGIIASGGSLTLRNSGIMGNTRDGGVQVSTGTTLIENTTLSGNASEYAGGGLAISSGTATLRNVTISGNTAKAAGGGLYTGSGSTLNLQNSTITNNRTFSRGGGIGTENGSLTINIESSIVSGNTSGGVAEDIDRRDGGTINATRSLLGALRKTDAINGTSTENVTALDPRLSPLQANGGPYPTHRPLPGSPAIDAGSNPATLTTDGRGTGFARQVGAGVDIGAVELDPAAPTATLAASNVDAQSPASAYTFTITFASTAGINTASLANAARVTGPGGFDVVATLASVDVATNGSPRVATYRFTPPGGTWDAADNGAYTVAVVAGTAVDVNNTAVPAGTVGGFTVNIARTFTVTNLNDAGAGSLRQALLDADAAVGADIVNFEAGLTGTIPLDPAGIQIMDSVTISGPGASVISVSGQNAGRIFYLYDGVISRPTDIVISGLTITGAAGNGSAIKCLDENLTLLDCVVTGNTGTNTSGGGAAYFYGGSTTIKRCVFSNNTATSNWGGAFYGRTTQMLIEDTTISGNTTARGGGGFFFNGGRLTMRRSTVSGNNATGTQGGGGFQVGFYSISVIENCTISGNTTAGAGGGIYLYAEMDSISLRNCTIAGNTATNNGGGLFQEDISKPVTIASSIFADNTGAVAAPEISGTVTADFSLIEDATGATITGTNNITAQDPQLAALANNGGLTQTRAIPNTSPAFNTGSNPANLTSDQRGLGFGRVSGSAADIGAFELDATPPTAALNATTVTVDSPPAQYDFIVSYTDDGSVDTTSLGNGNIRVTGPNGFDVAATFVSSGTAVNGQPLAVTYRITPPGGTWDRTDNGTYTVALVGGQVKDGSGNAATAATVGTFEVNINLAPVLGAITATPSSPVVNQNVTFSVPATDPEGSPLTYAWTFGDGGTSTAASPTRAFATIGTFMVQVTVSDGTRSSVATLNVTVTTPGGSLDPNDNDGDGIVNASDPDDDNDNISDEFETALGTDPLSPTSSPTGGVATPATLTVAKLGISLNFAKSGTDKITLSGSLPVPAGFTIANAKVALNVGGVVKQFTLSSKGAAKTGNDSFKIGIKAKKGVVAAQTSKYSASFSKGTFPAALADEGLTDVSIKKGARTVRVEIVFNNTLYRKDQTQSYTAGKGKGKTK